MKYEIRKIIGCKVIVISLALAFVFGLLFTYNVYIKGGNGGNRSEYVDKDEYNLYTGKYSEDKKQMIDNKVESLQNVYEETQSEQTLREMLVYLRLAGDAGNAESAIMYREGVVDNSQKLMESESDYYKRLNKKVNNIYKKPLNFSIGKSDILRKVSDVFSATNLVDIVFVMVLILFSSYLFLNEHKCNTYNMIKSSYRGDGKTYWNKIMTAVIFTIIVSIIQTISMTVLAVFVGGMEQWKTIIQLNSIFTYSPYNFNVFEMVIVVTVMRTIGYFTLVSLFVCVSLFFRRNIVPLAISTLIGIGGYAACYIMSGKYFATYGGVIREAALYKMIRKYTPYPLINAGIDYIKMYEPVNILGYPVPLMNIAIISNVVIAVFVVLAGYSIYSGNFRKKGA